MNVNFLIVALGSCLISAPLIDSQIITGGGKPLPPINGETISNSNSECFWAGTSPFCQAKCEAGFVTAKVDSKGDGAVCLTGTKSLCCPEGTNLANAGGNEGGCYWAGTSPLCNAKCAKDFFVKKHSASGDGAGCLFGNKKFCCPNSQRE